VPFGKTMHDAETFYVVVEGQVVINGVEIIEALFLTVITFFSPLPSLFSAMTCCINCQEAILSW
jgi:hypothetical protein